MVSFLYLSELWMYGTRESVPLYVHTSIGTNVQHNKGALVPVVYMIDLIHCLRQLWVYKTKGNISASIILL